MTQAQILQRLDRLEQQIQELKQKVATSPGRDARTWRDFIGMFENDPYFEKAVKAGAAYRASFRPGARKSKTRKK
jgi:hypothetical protein